MSAAPLLMSNIYDVKPQQQRLDLRNRKKIEKISCISVSILKILWSTLVKIL
jgi:hypothetical protein